MRPDLGRLRECQGASGVFSKPCRPVVSVSRSLRECHGADVKTVVRLGRLSASGRHTKAERVDGKLSQEFTSRLKGRQGVSGSLRASQYVSRDQRGPCSEALPTSRSSDTVRRMVQVLSDVQKVAVDAGESQVSARPAVTWHGTRNTVPSIAFAAASVATRCGHASESEGRR